jgi:hypothetical protein
MAGITMTVREFLAALPPDTRVRVGADKAGPGIHETPAAELLRDWQLEVPPNPHLDTVCSVMRGRLYRPNPMDPADLQVFLKPLTEGASE